MEHLIDDARQEKTRAAVAALGPWKAMYLPGTPLEYVQHWMPHYVDEVERLRKRLEERDLLAWAIGEERWHVIRVPHPAEGSPRLWVWYSKHPPRDRFEVPADGSGLPAVTPELLNRWREERAAQQEESAP